MNICTLYYCEWSFTFPDLVNCFGVESLRYDPDEIPVVIMDFSIYKIS